MTIETKHAPRRRALPALMLTALLLAGCSSGHIGETWQCPLAEGGSCDSVAAADPAVPAATGGTVFGEPLWLVRETGRPTAPASAVPCEAECGAFDPFGWLMRLFEAGSGDGEVRSDDGAAPTPDALRSAESRPLEPAAAALPAEPGPGQEGPAADDLREDGLRTGEVVARIWIAPFVDADGVYREASHVRVVLEPAGCSARCCAPSRPATGSTCSRCRSRARRWRAGRRRSLTTAGPPGSVSANRPYRCRVACGPGKCQVNRLRAVVQSPASRTASGCEFNQELEEFRALSMTRR